MLLYLLWVQHRLDENQPEIGQWLEGFDRDLTETDVWVFWIKATEKKIGSLFIVRRPAVKDLFISCAAK